MRLTLVAAPVPKPFHRYLDFTSTTADKDATNQLQLEHDYPFRRSSGRDAYQESGSSPQHSTHRHHVAARQDAFLRSAGV